MDTPVFDQQSMNSKPPVRVSSRIQAPDGYKIVQINNATLVGLPTPFSAQIMDEGREVQIETGVFYGRDSGWVPSAVNVVVEPLESVPTLAPHSQIRTFSYSKTLDIHESNITRQSFQESIQAPDDYTFKEVLKIDYQSLNKSPSKGAKIEIAKDGKSLLLSYSLESGPHNDRWRGWLDMFITAKLVSTSPSSNTPPIQLSSKQLPSTQPGLLPPGSILKLCGCWGSISSPFMVQDPHCISGMMEAVSCPGTCTGGGVPYAWRCR
ncbi:hypothetical protein [Pseudomonas sp. PDM27]|uniref:hypothetical protein n=1 Tax=Pseudomonas sp. PDM27 TaxID=2854769 RepID=UPI001C442C92|nr:hypothetical protein [Pseudomonas sp. PDM27]MBV7569642.1 hypothetical protein [Pseudomonas sp. PDM27]